MTKEQKEFIEKLFSLYSISLAKLAYRRTRDDQMARDLVQETFLTACRKPQKIYNHEKPLAWLYDRLNKLTLREKDRSYHSSEISLLKLDMIGDTDVDLQMNFILPTSLNEKERELILWRVDGGMSFAEIAEHRGITEDACRQQISRAVRKCKELMKQEQITYQKNYTNIQQIIPKLN